jgi:lysozyme family protein
MKFEHAVKVILYHEGGYVFDPDDPGGETKYGISKRQFPKLDIKNLTEDEASNIYYSYYYYPMKIAQIKNDLLGLHIFDMGVNAGISIAIKLIQRLVSVEDDGIIGNITLNAINNYPEQDNLIKGYVALRHDFYDKIIKKNPTLAKYKNGWYDRIMSTVVYTV